MAVGFLAVSFHWLSMSFIYFQLASCFNTLRPISLEEVRQPVSIKFCLS
jgi:hypothetical protein